MEVVELVLLVLFVRIGGLVEGGGVGDDGGGGGGSYV